MTTLRWTFYDPIAGDTWVMPRNPNAMSDVPLISRTLRTGPAWGADGRVPTFENAPPTQTLTFAGKVADQAHYEALLDWAQRPNEISISDHLDRHFIVFITAFRPDEQKPTKNNPWRVNYTVEAVILDVGGFTLGTAQETDTARS